MNFIIDGKPQGKQRPRVTRGGRHSYTPKETKDYQKKVIKSFIDSEGLNLGSVPIKVKMDCYYQIPKSMPKYKRKMVVEGSLFPLVKPDVDNVAKCVLDGLNGHAYKDDSCVVELVVSKFYSENPRIEVTLTEVL